MMPEIHIREDSQLCPAQRFWRQKIEANFVASIKTKPLHRWQSCSSLPYHMQLLEPQSCLHYLSANTKYHTLHMK